MSENKKQYNPYLGKAYAGGPHGVGDPNDMSLKKMENNVMITNMIKERAHLLKCPDQVKSWVECMEHDGIGIFKCKSVLNEMNECLKYWYSNTDFRKECEQLYLEKRKKFRETGITVPEKKRPYYISSTKFDPKYPEENELFRNRNKKTENESESNKNV